MDQLAAIPIIESVKSQIINPAIKLLLVVGVVYFLYGLVKFLSASRYRMDSQGAEEGKKHMVYGLIGLAVIISAFGIVNLIGSAVGTVFK